MTVYVLAVDGAVVKYPYTLTDMRRDNSDVSFPSDITDDIAAEFNVFHVAETSPPHVDASTQYLVWENPAHQNGKWVQVWGVADYTPEEIAQRLQQWRQTTSCTPFQGKAALHNAGLLDDVEALINNPDTDTLTKLAWNNAIEWKRLSPMIESLGTALGLSAEQIDNLFKDAQNIQA